MADVPDVQLIPVASDLPRAPYRAYLLRVWQSSDPTQWRVEIEPFDQKRRVFTTPAEVIEFINRQMGSS